MDGNLVIDCAREKITSDAAESCAVVSDDWIVCKAWKRTLLVRYRELEVYESSHGCISG